MSGDETLTVDFNIIEVQFISTFLRGIAELEDDDASDLARSMARRIQQKFIDAAVLAGLVPMDHLPAPEVDDE